MSLVTSDTRPFLFAMCPKLTVRQLQATLRRINGLVQRDEARLIHLIHEHRVPVGSQYGPRPPCEGPAFIPLRKRAPADVLARDPNVASLLHERAESHCLCRCEIDFPITFERFEARRDMSLQPGVDILALSAHFEFSGSRSHTHRKITRRTKPSGSVTLAFPTSTSCSFDTPVSGVWFAAELAGQTWSRHFPASISDSALYCSTFSSCLSNSAL
jgi:hypothetical protein